MRIIWILATPLIMSCQTPTTTSFGVIKLCQLVKPAGHDSQKLKVSWSTFFFCYVSKTCVLLSWAVLWLCEIIGQWCIIVMGKLQNHCIKTFFMVQWLQETWSSYPMSVLWIRHLLKLWNGKFSHCGLLENRLYHYYIHVPVDDKGHDGSLLW